MIFMRNAYLFLDNFLIKGYNGHSAGRLRTLKCKNKFFGYVKYRTSKNGGYEG